MNTILKTALSISTLMLATNSMAAKPLSQNQKLTQCKTLASEQFENTKSTRALNIKNSRSTFSAKFRVVGANERGMFLCTIDKSQTAQITRLDDVATKALVQN